jgi:hypothetical protein
MSIAEEIREVLIEVGSSSVIRQPDGTETTTDYIDDNSHAEHTNAAIRAFFIDLSLHSPTEATVGSTIKWGNTELLITSLSPQMFEDEVVEYVASGYVVNTKGNFYYYEQEETPDESENYDIIREWQELYPGLEIRGTIMDRLYRSMIKSIANESMDVETHKLNLFISDYYSEIAMGMQWRTTDGRKYKVEHVEDHNFIGIKVVFMSEELRK